VKVGQKANLPQEELAQLTITVIDQLIADCRYVNCLHRNDHKYLLQLLIIIVIIITRVITVLRLIVRDFAVSLSLQRSRLALPARSPPSRVTALACFSASEEYLFFACGLYHY